MRNNIVNRLLWLIHRRRKYAKLFRGFDAHWCSFADESSVFGEYNRLYAGTMVLNSRIGRFTYVADARIKNSDIGSFCSIGEEAMIGGFSRHPVRWLTTHPAFYSTRRQCGYTFSDTNKFEEEAQGSIIGHDVWVGTRAMVMDGVSVANGAIVAAGAVVTRNVDAYSIVAGVPAKPVGTRFSADVIQILAEWEWWNLPIETLLLMAPYFSQRESWTVDDVRCLIGMSRSDESRHNNQDGGVLESRVS